MSGFGVVGKRFPIILDRLLSQDGCAGEVQRTGKLGSDLVRYIAKAKTMA